MGKTNTYPLPVFHFRVNWGSTSFSFSEVSGMTQELQAIEYRTGDSADYSSIKMPGLRKYNNITLKRGINTSDKNSFFEWLNSVKMNEIQRRDITIMLLNEKDIPVVTWLVLNAFPVKLEGAQLKASGNEVAIESMEVAHEGLTVIMT
ncbi:MAG: phage tail protein [Bacteroidia bacterium]